MVVFTCNHCGETLQKPRVAKHYQFQCRAAPFLTCVDCFKDFRAEEYVAHTKCITEAERYGGKDYVPKASANKGEKKQQEWINVVNSLLDSCPNLSNAERSFLNSLSKFDNIPRKKAKFMNFIRSAMGNRMNMTIIESVWSKMEAAQKNNGPNAADSQQQNGKIIDKQNESSHDSNSISNKQHEQGSIAENQNNENIEREKQEEIQKNQDNTKDDLHPEGIPSKKEKSKKRPVTETTDEQLEKSTPQKKKKKSIVLLESSVNEVEEPSETPSFNWKCTIMSIVQNKGELSLKKLQKKVISQYMDHCSNTVSFEKASSKFSKKLKKVPEIIVSEDRVKLA